jgi:phosphatidylglycerophosphate synthase
MPASDPNRRPLKTRNRPWATALARWIAQRGLKPNQISVLSLLFAALAGGCFVLAAEAEPPARLALFFGAAAGIQLRLLCNMLDGMVAIWPARATPRAG